MDKVSTLKEARRELNGGGNHLVVKGKAQDIQIQAEAFLGEIGDKSLRMLAGAFIALVRDVRAKVVDREQAKIEVVALRELVNIKALDEAKGGKRARD